MRTRGGRTFWASLSGQRLRFAGDDALLAAIVDITARRQKQQNLQEQAMHDALTGVFNRRYVEDVLRSEIERAQRHERPLAVAMLDADHFKSINDTYGHPTGDEVLRAISDRCKKTLRSNEPTAPSRTTWRGVPLTRIKSNYRRQLDLVRAGCRN
jgi:predicted signal transduction protein with EAL and GGDEF domain